MTLWFDVEDLITYFRYGARPTGIQRLTFEIYRELWKAAGAAGKVRFCRHGATPAEYYVVDWPVLEAGILTSAARRAAPPVALPAAPEPAAHEPALPPELAAPLANGKPGLRRRVHHFLYPRITPAIRLPLGLIYRSQKNSMLALCDLLKGIALATRAPLRSIGRSQKNALLALRDLFKGISLVMAAPGTTPAQVGEVAVRLTTERVRFAPEDIFVSLGASWGELNAAAGPEVQKRFGLRYAVLIHDLIPELYPEWTSKEGLPAYRGWLREVVPHADHIFAVSRHSAADVKRRMAQWNKPVPEPVILPVGHRPPERHADAPPRRFDRPYILFVSTIEVRKNHALLFRVWRRLLETMPPEQVPYLVFAGKVAWLTNDLMVQLDNADWLDGHIKLVQSPAEPELAALYAGCEFTVFPSLYEGWGLPVSESLSHGKMVAASNRSAIPEAGGEFCLYFDPENVTEAYAVIRGLIEHPEQVRQMEQRIAERYRPPSWADTAAALLSHLLEAEQPKGKVRTAA